eukprot:scaffold47175_cov24-Cyclotella_meneghiniana.AAC.2
MARLVVPPLTAHSLESSVPTPGCKSVSTSRLTPLTGSQQGNAFLEDCKALKTKFGLSSWKGTDVPASGTGKKNEEFIFGTYPSLKNTTDFSDFVDICDPKVSRKISSARSRAFAKWYMGGEASECTPITEVDRDVDAFLAYDPVNYNQTTHQGLLNSEKMSYRDLKYPNWICALISIPLELDPAPSLSSDWIPASPPTVPEGDSASPPNPVSEGAPHQVSEGASISSPNSNVHLDDFDEPAPENASEDSGRNPTQSTRAV